MKTLSYSPSEWETIWNRLAKEHSALSMGKSMGFAIRKETEVWSFDDAPAGYDRVTMVYLDFEHDEDYTMFVLKYL